MVVGRVLFTTSIGGRSTLRAQQESAAAPVRPLSPERKPRALSPTQVYVNEFKVGSWGGSWEKKKSRLAKEQLFRNKVWTVDLSDGEGKVKTCRVNEMKSVKVGSRFYMREKKFTYIGTVTSAFRSLSCEELYTNYAELVRAAWSGELPDDRDGFFKMCNVSWEKVTLTDELDYQLRKTTKNGGRCMKQCGTIIPLH
jgi:hypothetical protein